jgi:hypothetical protein
MFCKEHPDYRAKQRPRVPCLSCWRLYFDSSGNKLEAYANAQPEAIKDWLVENKDAISSAPLAGITNLVTSTKVEVVPEERVEEVAKVEIVEAAKGTIV